jgi:hypothetical protein
MKEKPFVIMSKQFLYEAVQESMESAVKYGVQKAYETFENPTESQIAEITEQEVMNCLNRMFNFNTKDEDWYDEGTDA